MIKTQNLLDSAVAALQLLSRVCSVGALLIILGLSPAAHAAQYQDLGERLAENSKTLRSYSWNMRTEVRLQGQPQSTTLEKLRYDIDGNLQVTPMGGSGQLTSDLQQAVDALTRLGFSYAQPQPAKLEQFMGRASVWEGKGRNAGTDRIEGEDFLSPGDIIEIRAKNQRADRLNVETSLNGTQVAVRADYRRLPQDGPAYVARLTVTVPTQGLEVVVENFDYTRNAPVAAGDVSILPEGTEVQVRLTQALSSSRNKAGESYQAVVDQDVVINGRTVIPKGTAVTGRLIEVKGSGRVRGRAKMSINLASISLNSRSLAIETNTLSFEAEGTRRRDAGRTAGATGMGAVIGAIAGGGSGAAKGAAIGAGVGVGATLMTKGREVEFQAEQLMSFKLTKPLEIGR
jgi:hypothetical protein